MGGSGATEVHTHTFACETLSTIFCGGLVAEVMRGRFESDQTRLRAKLSHRENVEQLAARALFHDVTASGTKTHTLTLAYTIHTNVIQKGGCRRVWKEMRIRIHRTQSGRPTIIHRAAVV